MSGMSGLLAAHDGIQLECLNKNNKTNESSKSYILLRYRRVKAATPCKNQCEIEGGRLGLKARTYFSVSVSCHRGRRAFVGPRIPLWTPHSSVPRIQDYPSRILQHRRRLY